MDMEDIQEYLVQQIQTSVARLTQVSLQLQEDILTTPPAASGPSLTMLHENESVIFRYLSLLHQTIIVEDDAMEDQD